MFINFRTRVNIILRFKWCLSAFLILKRESIVLYWMQLFYVLKTKANKYIIIHQLHLYMFIHFFIVSGLKSISFLDLNDILQNKNSLCAFFLLQKNLLFFFIR